MGNRKSRWFYYWCCNIATKFDVATGYFEIGALLALDGQWQKLEKLGILMGDEVSKRTKKALLFAIFIFRSIIMPNTILVNRSLISLWG